MPTIELNKNQEQYLDIILESIKRVCTEEKIIMEKEISEEEFKTHFTEIFTTCHNQYQQYLKGLLTDKKLKSKLAEEVWNTLRKDSL